MGKDCSSAPNPITVRRRGSGGLLVWSIIKPRRKWFGGKAAVPALQKMTGLLLGG